MCRSVGLLYSFVTSRLFYNLHPIYLCFSFIIFRPPDHDAPVQGPLPYEPDDAPWKKNSESGIRKLLVPLRNLEPILSQFKSLVIVDIKLGEYSSLEA